MTASSDWSAATGSWVIDAAHTTLGFSARHAMVARVRGGFDDFAGTFTIAADGASSHARVTIQTASIETKNSDRDAHLKSGDFLDVETFPTIEFTSTSTRVTGANVLVTGDLTIRGVTRSVTVDFELVGISTDPWGGTRIGFEGSTKLSRKDFGLVWNVALESGGFLVGDDVTLTIDVEAIKQA